jgi:putative DNA methylase
MVATDPPYYDNIGYADLSDFFYVWQRRTLRDIWPNLFRRVLVPKGQELVATPYRHGGRDAAERFFMDGMAQALSNMHTAGIGNFPVTIYYAFKQAEVAREGLTSPGWATFLQAVFDAGYVIDRTWPVRTELSNRTIAMGSNALASSVVLVCRKRSDNAQAITRREFVARLRGRLPDALKKIREGGVGPVDMAQASIGPGMGIFTAASSVLEPDDTPMSVRAAIALINQVRDEIAGEEATGYDSETRFCIDWFEEFGMDESASGDAIGMAQAHDIGIDALQKAGVVSTYAGRARLLRRDELPADWHPGADKRLTDWKCAQHLARVIEAPDGGMDAAARLYSEMGAERGEVARNLAYRLYDICERKGRAKEAQVWNTLAQEWTALDAALIRVEEESRRRSEGQGDLGHGLPGWDG